MTLKQRLVLIGILAVVCAIIVCLQYKAHKERRERLTVSARYALITARHYSSMGVNYAHYYFITAQGQRIEAHQKCGREFDKYVNAFAIYNPKNPVEYELSFDFFSYNATWVGIFHFALYLPAMIFVMFGFINVGITIYLKFKR